MRLMQRLISAAGMLAIFLALCAFPASAAPTQPSGQEIVAALKAASEFTCYWGFEKGVLNYDDVDRNDEITYSFFISDIDWKDVPCWRVKGKSSINEVLADAKKIYTDKAAKEFVESIGLVERNGKLYVGWIWATGEGGQALEISANIRAVSPTQYVVEITQTNDYIYGEFYTRKFHYVYENGRWAFSEDVGRQYSHEDIKLVGFDDSALRPSTPSKTAYASTQIVTIDGKPTEFQMYALRDVNGNDTNYIKLRDIALALRGTPAQFNVVYFSPTQTVYLLRSAKYKPDGSEMKTPFTGDRAYTIPDSKTVVDDRDVDLKALLLTSDDGGGYTYYKLRDLGEALGFKVGWSAGKGVFIETVRH